MSSEHLQCVRRVLSVLTWLKSNRVQRIGEGLSVTTLLLHETRQRNGKIKDGVPHIQIEWLRREFDLERNIYCLVQYDHLKFFSFLTAYSMARCHKIQKRVMFSSDGMIFIKKFGHRLIIPIFSWCPIIIFCPCHCHFHLQISVTIFEAMKLRLSKEKMIIRDSKQVFTYLLLFGLFSSSFHIFIEEQG